MYHNDDVRCAFILVVSTERYLWLWTYRLYVCIPVTDFDRVSGVRSRARSYSHIITCIPLPYATMAMIGVHLCWLNRWNVDFLSGRTARTFAFLCLTGSCYWHSIQCEVVILPSFLVKIMYFNGDGRCSCILVKSMEHSRWTWTNRTCVCICAWLEAVVGVRLAWGHNVTRILCQNTLRWRWSVFVQSIPLPLDDQIVSLYFCAWLLIKCHSGSIQCQSIILPSCALSKYNCDGRSARSERTASAFVFLRAWLWSGFGDSTSSLRSLISYHNILRWWWLVCVYLDWINITLSLDLDE